MTDAEIKELIERPKILRRYDVSRLSCNDKNLKGAYWRFDAKIESESDDLFTLYGRCCVDDQSDFSAILSVELADRGARYLLLRCNGPHPHYNHLERMYIDGTHVHMATQRYADHGYKIEGYAETTDAYSDFEGALNHLMVLAHISIEPDGDRLRGQIKVFREGGDQDDS